MKKYIDCDGVILDTETGLFDEYYENKKRNPELNKRLYLQQLNWIYWINQAKILNDSIEILKNYDCLDVDILTKVHSLQEGIAKIKYFRDQKLKNNIIIVPDGISKSTIVNASGNILVDDNVSNLDDWNSNKGISIYYGLSKNEYPKINSLDEILNPLKLEKILYYKKQK